MNSAKLLLKITEKWHIKVLSVAAALIISIFYRMNTLETRFLTVPLMVEASETLTPAVVFASAVRVSLRGETEGIHPILEEDIEAFIDLTRFTSEGIYRAPVQVRKKGNALGVEPLEISVLPIEIPIILEQKVTRNIPVFPVFRGTVAEDFELTNQSVIPASIIAEGPRSLIDNQVEFITETINLDRRHENFSIMVNVINDNPLISIHGNRMIEYRGTISRIMREEDEQLLHEDPSQEDLLIEHILEDLLQEIYTDLENYIEAYIENNTEGNRQ